MTRVVRALRYPLLVAAAAGVLFAVYEPPVVAPGPPREFIEPQTGMVLVAIEPGRFTMGSPADEPGRQPDETRHDVVLTKRIYMGRFEVTQAEWQIVLREKPSVFDGCGRCPVENVDFYRVGQFLSNLNAPSTAVRYRLPTEAEWEYACRAGTTTAYAVGDHLTAADANVDTRAHLGGVEPRGAQGRTMPVGRFRANAWGLFDMHGNVWEWTNDWYGPYPDGPVENPTGSTVGPKRVIRGGSWHFDANSARCGLRYTHAPQDKGFSLGFRVVAEQAPGRRHDTSGYLNR